MGDYGQLTLAMGDWHWLLGTGIGYEGQGLAIGDWCWLWVTGVGYGELVWPMGESGGLALAIGAQYMLCIGYGGLAWAMGDCHGLLGNGMHELWGTGRDWHWLYSAKIRRLAPEWHFWVHLATQACILYKSEGIPTVVSIENGSLLFHSVISDHI
jgi:hypothetical protein